MNRLAITGLLGLSESFAGVYLNQEGPCDITVTTEAKTTAEAFKNININKLGKSQSSDLFIGAVKKGDFEFIKQSLKKGVDNNSLSIAAIESVKNSNSEILKLILKEGIDINQLYATSCKWHSTTLLSTAIELGEVKSVKVLLDNGAKTNVIPYIPAVSLSYSRLVDSSGELNPNQKEIMGLLVKSGALADGDELGLLAPDKRVLEQYGILKDHSEF